MRQRLKEYCRERTVPHLDKVATDYIDYINNRSNENPDQNVCDYSLLICVLDRDFSQLICDFSLLICVVCLKHLEDLQGP